MWAMKVCPALLTAYLVALFITETSSAAETTFSKHEVTYRRMIKGSKDYLRLDCYRHLNRMGVVQVLSIAGPAYKKPKYVFTVRLYTISSCDDIFYFEGEKFRLTYDLSKRQTSFRVGYRLADGKFMIKRLLLTGEVVELFTSDEQHGLVQDDEDWDKITGYKYYYQDQSKTIVYLLKHLQGVDSQVEYIQVDKSTAQGETLINTMPYKSVPVLELTYSGTRISGIYAISRYLVTKTTWAPISLDEYFHIETVADQFTRIHIEFEKILKESDASKVEALKSELKQSLVPVFNRMDVEVKLYSYLANGKPSWVDLEFVDLVETLNELLATNVLKDYQYLANLIARVKQFMDKQ